MWNLPRPRIEPVSPSLAGRFLTTGPPRKSSGTPSKEAANQDAILRPLPTPLLSASQVRPWHPQSCSPWHQRTNVQGLARPPGEQYPPPVGVAKQVFHLSCQLQPTSGGCLECWVERDSEASSALSIEGDPSTMEQCQQSWQ